MLSRVANSLYWMSRYIERAENIARIVDVNLQLLLDLRNLDEERLAKHWLPIVQTTGDEEQFFALHKKATGAERSRNFWCSRRKTRTPSSPSICQARENARMVRDQITIELWEELNRLYWFVRTPTARQVWKESPSEFFQQIKASSLLIIGLTYATLIHNEGWWFAQAGKFIERADKTSRILDLRYANAAGKRRAADRQRNRRARMVGHPALVQRVGRLQNHSRRGSQPAARRGISAAQRGFSALRPFLRGRTEPRAPPNLRRGGREILQRRRKTGRAGWSRNCSSSPLTKFLTPGLHGYLDDAASASSTTSAARCSTPTFSRTFNNLEDEIMVQQEEQQQQSQINRL